MTAPPQHRVPHVRDGFIVANVGLGTCGNREYARREGHRGVEAPASLHPTATFKVEVES